MGNNGTNFVDPDGGMCVDVDGNPIPCPDGYGNFIGPTVDTAQFIDGEFVGLALDEVVVTASFANKNNSNLALTGNMIGGINGALNNSNIFNFYNSAPDGKFAVSYNGNRTYWSDNFRGGTRGNISASFVDAAKKKASSIRLGSKIAGYASATGSVLGYYSAAENLYNGDYGGAASEGGSNTISIVLAVKSSNLAGLSWTGGWELGRYLSTTEIYNRVLFGVHSKVYKQRGLQHGWIGSKLLDD